MGNTTNGFNSDYREENTELQENLQNEFQDNTYADYDFSSEDSYEVPEENDDENSNPAKPSQTTDLWKKIAKVALIVLAFVALFFASMWVTTIVLDRNHQVEDYDNDAPEYTNDEDEEEFGIVIDTDDVEENVTVVEDEEKKEPDKKPSTSGNKKPASSPSANKQDDSKKPADSDDKKADTPADDSQNTSDSEGNTADKPAQDDASSDTSNSPSPDANPEPVTPAPEPSAPSTAPVPSAPTLIPSRP